MQPGRMWDGLAACPMLSLVWDGGPGRSRVGGVGELTQSTVLFLESWFDSTLSQLLVRWSRDVFTVVLTALTALASMRCDAIPRQALKPPHLPADSEKERTCLHVGADCPGKYLVVGLPDRGEFREPCAME